MRFRFIPGLLVAVYLIWLAANRAGIEARALVSAGAWLFFSLPAAGWCAYRAYRAVRLAPGARPGLGRGALRRAWALFAAALLLLSLEAGRRLLQTLGQPLPAGIPFRDIFLLPALALALAGLLLQPIRLHPLRASLPNLLDALVTIVVLLASAWMLVVSLPNGPYSAGFPRELLLYPALGLALMLAVLLRFLLTDPRSVPFVPAPTAWQFLAVFVWGLAGLSQPFSAALWPPLARWWSGAGWALGAALFWLAALQPGPSQPFTSPRLVRRAARIQTILPHALVLLLVIGTLVAWLATRITQSELLWLIVLLSLAVILRELLQAGQARFQQYANLVNSIAEPAFVCDEAGLLRLVNPALLAASGFPSARELLGQPLHIILGSAERAEHMLSQAMARDIRPGDTVPLGWTGETTLRRRDGALVPVYLSLRPVIAWDELPVRGTSRLAVAGTAHDLTYQKQQQAALRQAYEQVATAHDQLATLNAELEQKVAEETANLSAAYVRLEEQNRKLQMLDRLKSDFVSLVSHELRAPLTNINGGIELLLSRPTPLEPGVQRKLELVQSEILRLTRFVETILDLSALDAGRLPLYPAPVLLADVLATLRNQLANLPALARIRWPELDGLPALLADERALTSVLFHLLDNALKYAPQGEVAVEAGLEENMARISVADRGPGIPAEALPLLFDRFYRSNSADSQTVYGHGLGLYIVRRLIEAMRGRVEAANRPEGGACFTCWLPLAAQEEEVDHAAHPAGG